MTLIIAHRGASGYLPEHTLPSKALAFAMGADYLEQDVVASRDDELIVCHDIHLDRVTDVREQFPGRAREDGRYYVRDFDLAELRTLKVSERVDESGAPVYPDRFPVGAGRFRLHTLGEELEFVRGLNESSGRHVGVYPEVKRPAWHREEGVDIAPALLAELERSGFGSDRARVFVQCFDPDELVRIRTELHAPYPLVQLIGDDSWQESTADYVAMQTPAGLSALAGHVDAIGPWVEQLYRLEERRIVSTGLAETAHATGLAVHPYTFRLDSLPPGFGSYEALVRFVVGELDADGLFTDFPDVTRRITTRLE